MNPFVIFKLVTAGFSVFKLLLNAGKAYRFFKTMSGIGSSLVREHRLPKCGESKEFLHSLRELVASGIIDIPGVDENEIAKAIQDLENEVQCPAA